MRVKTGHITRADLNRCREEEGFWAALATRLLHPVQLHIIEALRWIGRPLSAAQLAKVLGDGVTLTAVAYHVRRLVEVGALSPAGKRQKRGAREKFVRLDLRRQEKIDPREDV